MGNVIAYYPPLIKPFEMANHWFWSNFFIGKYNGSGTRKHFATRKELEESKGFNLDKYKGIDKLKIIRNCVEPETGLHILNESIIDYQKELFRDK